SSCVPASAMVPLSTTRIWSAFWIVARRCAMVMIGAFLLPLYTKQTTDCGKLHFFTGSPLFFVAFFACK
ncbi:MAG: hypothetical protein PUF59_10425, partial [Lachnospiraceae bacterium]|nr:hypothetical protein [Lachnospiraceae bacterium]